MNPWLEELIDLIKLNKMDDFVSGVRQYHDKHNFDVNHTNEYGNTMMHIACRCRNYNVVAHLIENYDVKLSIQNDDKRVPLHFAIMYGSVGSITHIFDAKTNMMNISKIISLLIDRAPHTLLIRDKDKKTPKDYLDVCFGKDFDFSSMLKSSYRQYKRYVDFFESLQQFSMDNDDYDLSVSIFCALSQ